jgi:hypothetical protein
MEEFGRDRRLGRAAWLRYLATGTLLAVTRVALLAWMNHRLATHTSTETDSFLIDWLYPEAFVSIFWRSILGVSGTKYYLTYGSLITVGSFVMAIPILLVGWLRQRHLFVQIGFCALIIPAVTALLRVIVLLFGLSE